MSGCCDTPQMLCLWLFRRSAVGSVDRENGEVRVHSEPDGVRYGTVRIVPFGKEITPPEPVGIHLETEELKNWVR